MVKSHPGIDSLLSKLREVNLTAADSVSQHRTMEIREETFRVLKEHASKHYSSPNYDEMLVNLKFYEENDGPKDYND